VVKIGDIASPFGDLGDRVFAYVGQRGPT